MIRISFVMFLLYNRVGQPIYVYRLQSLTFQLKNDSDIVSINSIIYTSGTVQFSTLTLLLKWLMFYDFFKSIEFYNMIATYNFFCHLLFY